jgi:hypothetical protein
MKGYRSARAGARRDSLALRCPVVTTQPDGPGSGLSCLRVTFNSDESSLAKSKSMPLWTPASLGLLKSVEGRHCDYCKYRSNGNQAAHMRFHRAGTKKEYQQNHW